MSTSCILYTCYVIQYTTLYTYAKCSPLNSFPNRDNGIYIHIASILVGFENGFFNWFSILVYTIGVHISHCAQMRDVLIITILRTLPLLVFLCQKRAFFKNIFLLSRHSSRQFRRANVYCHCEDYKIFYACCIYYIFFHTLKKRKTMPRISSKKFYWETKNRNCILFKISY